MYPTYLQVNDSLTLSSNERKKGLDAICTNAYNEVKQGKGFTCSNLQNAEFIASYLTLVFGKHYTWVYDDSVYYIIPA